MPSPPIAARVSTQGKLNRRVIAWTASALLVVTGLALGGLKILDDRSQNGAPSLADVEKFLFVPSRDAPQVTVIDSRSDRVVTRIAMPGLPRQVLVSEAVGAMVASFPDRSVLELVDLSSPASRLEIDLTIAPDFIVLSPDGYLIAAADGGRGAVSVVSLRKRQPLLRLSGFGDPRNLTFSLDGSQLYITDRTVPELAVVDIVQQSVIVRTALTGDVTSDRIRGEKDAPGVSALTRTPDGRYGFVSIASLDSLIVVDLSTFKPVKQIHVGRAPLRPYGTADGRLMLVPNDGDQTVSIIDTTTLEMVATLPGARDVSAINTGWFESLAFVMSRQNRIVVLDLMEFRKLGDIELPGSPGAGVVTSNGQKLYTTLSDANQVAVVDTQAHKLRALIDGVGRQPAGVILARSNNYCH